MKTWDDLNDEELAQLNDKEMNAHLKRELMVEGIAPMPPDCAWVDEEEPKVNLHRYYKVTGCDAIFTRREDAETFAAMRTWKTNRKYFGKSYTNARDYVEPIEEESRQVQEVMLPREGDLIDQLTEMTIWGEARDANAELKKAKENHDEQTAEVRSRMYRQRAEARTTVAELNHVRSVWAEYQEMSESEEIAARFMTKTFAGKEKLLTAALGRGWNTFAVAEELSGS